MLYLDHAATTPLRPEAVAAMEPYLGSRYGNPSGLHAVARTAKNAIEEARERIAAVLGVAPGAVVFTGSGTEADNLAVLGTAVPGRAVVVTDAGEHDAVLASANHAARTGGRTAVLGIDADGRVDPDEVLAAVDAATTVVSIMTANNETGARQPVRKIADAVHGSHPGVLVHTDAVQSVPTEEVTVESTGADLMTISAHKFGGPKGVGALTVPETVNLEPVIHGGGQERGRRSGTHNVASIVGMAAALEAAVADRPRVAAVAAAEREAFEQAVRAAVDDVEVHAVSDRLPQHSSLRLPGADSETVLIRLDQEGVAASAGSACHSGAIDASHVLLAMGRTPREAAETVRLTFGWTTEAGDGSRAAAAVIAILGELR